MTLNYIWWLYSYLEVLGNVEYSFIAITLKLTPTQNDSTC